MIPNLKSGEDDNENKHNRTLILKTEFFPLFS